MVQQLAPNNFAGVLSPALKVGQLANFISPPLIQQLSNQETQARLEKDLCYYCNEKFVPDHRRQNPQLFMINILCHYHNSTLIKRIKSSGLGH